MAVTKCAFLLRNAPAANTPVALSMLAGMAVGAVAIHGSLALPDPWEPRRGALLLAFLQHPFGCLVGTGIASCTLKGRMRRFAQ
jgi:hypothetical protein